MATYGSLVMNYFGHGKGYLRDFLRVNSDVKTAISHLELKKEDMLVWEYGTGLEVFKPKFYICRDRRTDSLVVCFRGTFVRGGRWRAIYIYIYIFTHSLPLFPQGRA